MKMYPADYMALRQRYLSLPPGPEKARLGLQMRTMQAEAEDEYDSATDADPGDAQPQMVEVAEPNSGVPANVLMQAAQQKQQQELPPEPEIVKAAIQYKQPGKGQGRLRPSPLAMAEINAKAVARGEPPPYPTDEIAKQSEKQAEQPTPVLVPQQDGSFTMPQVEVEAQAPQQPQTQQVEYPQGPAAAESPGRTAIPGLPGADQQIADIEARVANGTATVNDQLMLQMLKGQQQKQQQQMLPPGYGDMGHARAGMAGLSNPGYKDVEEGAMQFLPSLIQMLNNLNRGGR